MIVNKLYNWVLLVSVLGTGFFLDLGKNLPDPAWPLSLHQGAGRIEPIRQVVTDSIQYELFLAYDGEEKPLHYFAEIFTPVCYSDKCYPVYIHFYWDLLGNYQYYELPEGKVLTKSDHIKFEKADHDKLQQILHNPSSILKNYKAEDLVVSTETENPTGVDAVTGATLKTIKNEVIEGAVYSCYTLWHIAHGIISDSIQSYTAGNLLDKDLLIRFLQSSNYHYQYWAMERTLVNGKITDEQYVDPLLSVIRGKNIFASKNFLEKLPAGIFEDKEKQLWLWESYLCGSYPLQMAILDKLKELDLSSDFLSLLIGQLSDSNQEQKKKIFSLLRGHQGLSKASQEILSGYLEDVKWEKEAYAILNDQKNLNPKIKKEITAYKKKN